jgi:hypothetical protein
MTRTAMEARRMLERELHKDDIEVSETSKTGCPF